MIDEKLELTTPLNIKNMIYEIRGKQVMLDSDLAVLYEVTNGTKGVNLAVKRNIERFPEDFYFQLTLEEYDNILKNKSDSNLHFQNETTLQSSRFQNETLNEKTKINGRGSNIKYLPYVFTEQGVAMLSSVLRTSKASEVSVKIMRAFVEMKKFMLNNYVVLKRLNQHEVKFIEHDEKFAFLYNKLPEEEIPKGKIFFEGETFAAYILMIGIIEKAKENIIIIDNYIDKTILDVLTKKKDNVSVLIVTSKHCKLTDLDIEKFNSQYPTLEIKYSNAHHDRYIILDNEFLYNCGASLKDLGKKTFSINKLEDKSEIERLINVCKN